MVKLKKVGVLGGGQLARMLAQSGLSMGIEVHVLSKNSNDPAAQVSQFWQKGSPSCSKDLKKFSHKVDTLTFESEFLDMGILTPFRKKISPSPHIMKTLQDKLFQKKLLEKHGLKTTALVDKDTFPCVAKKRTLGYDGYGVFFLSQKQDLKKLPQKTNLIFEEKVPFQRELAISAARNKKAQVVFTPLVETFQENRRCLWVKGPVKHQKLKSLKAKIKKFLNAIKYEGLITFEFLQDPKKGLLINEVAPRVHNSAHYSIEALTKSQFALHLKAILNEPLSEPQILTKNFAMMNLISTGRSSVKLLRPSSLFLHWYGKQENRKNRKMGHITVLNQSLDFLKKQRKEFLL